MWPWTLLILIPLSFSIHASTTFTTRIHALDEAAGEDTLVLLTSGHVAVVPKNQKSFLPMLREVESQGAQIQVTLNKDREIEDYEILSRTKFVSRPNLSTEQEFYEPTIVENMDLARTYFKEARFKDKESQCFNRAHSWVYEWFIKNTLYSNKTWIFFTRKYIRKYKFEWWFHVSPSIKVLEQGMPREKIMDIKYTRGPTSLKRWTDIFMQNDADCPMVSTYSDYANYPETGWCYTMRTSMFYYQPFDIESKETWGSIKSNWVDEDVKQAFLDALDETI